MKKRPIMWILVLIIISLVIIPIFFINQPSFGKMPSGERVEKIKQLPNYREGKLHNISQTQRIIPKKPLWKMMYEFIFHKIEGLRPIDEIPVVKTDLKSLASDEDILVWLGHSSTFMQVEGMKVLIDPVLVMGSPVSFVNKAFKGADYFKPSDIPEIDYLLITHDHWDHLDYNTMLELKDRVSKVIVPLGVGEHLEYWGFAKSQIVELSWQEQVVLDHGFKLTCLPTRHFSGRGLVSNKTLWGSFMLETPLQTIYIGGDGGYDTFFRDIGKQFNKIDLAILENGQYNEEWKYIHFLPADLLKVIQDLNPERVLTVHNSKFALAKHHWKEPLINISTAAERDSINLLTPRIGEPVYLRNKDQLFDKWWEEVE